MGPLRKSLGIIAVLTGVFVVIAGAKAGAEIKQAIALIYPVADEKVAGELHLLPTAEGLKITGSFMNLEPGRHGFHVHQYGNCTAPNQDSVGPHFSPKKAGEEYHGDLPQVEAGKDGKAGYKAVVGKLSFAGEYSVIGRGLVIHGLDGKKIGCGVIGIAE